MDQTEDANPNINEDMEDEGNYCLTKGKEDVGPYINEDMKDVGIDCLTKDNENTSS